MSGLTGSSSSFGLAIGIGMVWLGTCYAAVKLSEQNRSSWWVCTLGTGLSGAMLYKWPSGNIYEYVCTKY
jgi:hypothetical protein